MGKANNSSVWKEAGYTLFAEEGPEGIQVERLARILQLNKSGFYHYFGDLEIYIKELVKLHQQKTEIYLSDLLLIKNIDPDYLHLAVEHKTPIMFHLNLIRANNPSFSSVAERINQREASLLCEMWTQYLGRHESPSLAIRSFGIVRDMFYARLSFQNFNYPFLHNLMTQAKIVMARLTESRTELVEANDAMS